MTNVIAHDAATLSVDRHGPSRPRRRLISSKQAWKSATDKLVRHVAVKGVADLRKLVADNEETLELLREHCPEVHAAFMRTFAEIEQVLRTNAQ